MSGSTQLRNRSAAALLPASLLGAVLIAAPFAGTTTMPLAAGTDPPALGSRPHAARLLPTAGQPRPVPRPGCGAPAAPATPRGRPMPAPGPRLRPR